MQKGFGNGGDQEAKCSRSITWQAIRLVVLTQTSSCFIERVFSKLKLIRDAVGDNMLENITEIRLLVQCNGTY